MHKCVLRNQPVLVVVRDDDCYYCCWNCFHCFRAVCCFVAKLSSSCVETKNWKLRDARVQHPRYFRVRRKESNWDRVIHHRHHGPHCAGDDDDSHHSCQSLRYKSQTFSPGQFQVVHDFVMKTLIHETTPRRKF